MDWKDQTDPMLRRACLQGQAAAWYELVERYAQLVFAIPLAGGLTLAEADQVFQSVFQALYKGLGGLAEAQELAAWLILVTYREVQRALRGGRDPADPAEAPTDLEPPPDRVRQWRQAHYVRLALRRLDPPCRELLTILFRNGHEAGGPSTNGRLGLMRAHCFQRFQVLLAEMGIVSQDDSGEG